MNVSNSDFVLQDLKAIFSKTTQDNTYTLKSFGYHHHQFYTEIKVCIFHSSVFFQLVTCKQIPEIPHLP